MNLIYYIDPYRKLSEDIWLGFLWGKISVPGRAVYIYFHLIWLPFLQNTNVRFLGWQSLRHGSSTLFFILFLVNLKSISQVTCCESKENSCWFWQVTWDVPFTSSHQQVRSNIDENWGWFDSNDADWTLETLSNTFWSFLSPPRFLISFVVSFA